MSTLLELQRDFSRALLTGDETALQALVAADGMSVAERIDVHRNNVVSSLTDVLAETYPALCRLVDPRFFAYAAYGFLTTEPPERPRLAEYGARFAGFIETFGPCRHLPYLADVARLEWLVHAAAEAPETTPVTAGALQDIAPEATPRIALGFDPSIGYLESPWPIDRIWEANRDESPGTGEADPGTIDLDAGGVHLEVARTPQGIVLRPLDLPTFAFRSALQSGSFLEIAAQAALGADSAFDLASALVALFSAGTIVTVGLAPSPTTGDTPCA